jgi:predicted nucleic acid-binding Zn ribbon protein
MNLDSHTGRKKEVAPLEAAFQDLLKAYRLEDKFKEKLLISSWPELVGKTIADRTGNIFIKEKKLFVKITSGPIKKELQLSKSKVLQLIEERMGKSIIEDLVFI